MSKYLTPAPFCGCWNCRFALPKLSEKIAEKNSENDGLRSDLTRAEDLLETIHERMADWDVCDQPTAEDVQKMIDDYFFHPVFTADPGETGADFTFDFYDGDPGDENDYRGDAA